MSLHSITLPPGQDPTYRQRLAEHEWTTGTTTNNESPNISIICPDCEDEDADWVRSRECNHHYEETIPMDGRSNDIIEGECNDTHDPGDTDNDWECNSCYSFMPETIAMALREMGYNV